MSPFIQLSTLYTSHKAASDAQAPRNPTLRGPREWSGGTACHLQFYILSPARPGSSGHTVGDLLGLEVQLPAVL